MLLGAGALAFNLGFIFMGTYHWFTWDIVEPIAYFMDLSTSIALMGLFFLGRRGQYNNEWFKDYLKRRSLNNNKEWVKL